MQVLSVSLGDRSYPIYIGSALLNQSSLLNRHVKASQVLIVTNETIAPLYLAQTQKLFADFSCSVAILQDGECFKSLEVLNSIFDKLLQDKHSRATTLVALGGGVIGDMTGFAAACYQRGVAFIQIPTTLLAQVDSSVGGKTGVNHPLGKNMIGAFHQPSCVLIDVETLDTLPDREYRSGLAEIIKYGLINDRKFFDWLYENMGRLLNRDRNSLIHAIATSCSNKAKIVAEDERESGVRALLNFGHTFGHAIESWQEYKGFLHGEAVAIGSIVAAELSCRLGYLSRVDKDRIYNMFLAAGLPVFVPDDMDSSTFFDFMQRDKKVIDGRLRLILLKSIGQAVISEDASNDQIIAAIDGCRSSV
ncbi:MAG TPA: 3-dehydroquinate synthase [Pseudomonadales bacterium]|nr:3-dehydroquinate synthase [Pseudomonadales bacterium]